MSSLARRVHEFLDKEGVSIYNTVGRQGGVRTVLTDIKAKMPDTFVFGGMIRDFALGPSSHFKSDIDLVSLSSRSDIYRSIMKYEPKINRFGGFRFYYGYKYYDIWSFEDTWAFREGLVEGASISDLCRTTFFNLDAACQKLGDDQLICADNFLRDVSHRILDINLADNPSPQSIVARALRLIVRRKLSVSGRLQEYILENVPSEFWNQTFARALLIAFKHNMLGDSYRTFNFQDYDLQQKLY